MAFQYTGWNNLRKLFERRTAMRERVEILIANDSEGNETWVDMQEWLDNSLLIVPRNGVIFTNETLSDYKKAHEPTDPNA